MDRDIRKKIVMDRLSYDNDPDAFVEQYNDTQEKLRQKLLAAKDRLKAVKMSRDLEVRHHQSHPRSYNLLGLQLKVSQICGRLRVEGLRGDIVTCRAARALVALEDRQEVTLDDIERVICLSLNHRMRKDPLDPIDSGKQFPLLPSVHQVVI